jgi:hypothetical protein
MFSKLNSIIKHPFTTKIFDIVIGGFLVGAVVYFVVEQKEIEPRYAISTPEMIAEATADAPRLKLLWDNEEVHNVYTLKIAIWNAGREYLDKNSISATDPIRVMIPPNVQILYADFIRTSRENLDLDATDLSSTGTKAIQIEIVGDEALERNDGGVLKILYTRQSNHNGRIKGCRQGFKEVGWATVTLPPYSYWWVLVMPLIYILMILSPLIRNIKAFCNGVRDSMIIVNIFLIILSLVPLCIFAWFFFLKRWLLSPGWII